MKKAILMLAMIFVFHLYAKDIQVTQNQLKMNSLPPKFVEVVLVLPFESLIINSNGIDVDYEGNLLAVHSLERSGEQWLIRAGRNCPNGHCIVCKCNGCAVSSCGYCCACYSDYKKAP